MTGHRYLAFGLVVESARPILSLSVTELPSDGPPDVKIVEGHVSFPDKLQNIEGVDVSVQGDNFFLHIDECGSFQVTGGHTITVQSDSRATVDQVNLYLLGSIFGVLLHQRRILPFHCNAVEIEGAAFLFCGDSGAGKSTLAAHFVDRGFRLFSDDMCAVHFGKDGRLIAVRGVARLKLWQDSIEALGRTSRGLRLVPWHDEKFELPLSGEVLADPLPVAALYHLRLAEEGRAPGIHPLRGLEAVNSVTANIYRRRFGDLAGAAPFYLAATARIIDEVPVFAMNRNWGFDHFREEAFFAEDHMRGLARESISTRP